MSDHILADRQMPSKKPETTYILTFDGGGVRGLSSLIILKRLMKCVNEQDGLQAEGLTPKDLFSLVAGTSTGGLIALMLGRFGMSVDDCIAQYFEFSAEIFGHYSKRGKWSRGLLKERYDGTRLRNSVRKLAARKDTCDNQSVFMQGPEHKNGIPCTVLAAEFEGDDIRDEPAYLCTHNCDAELQCRVCDAAQATTAAPSYFPFCRIGGRYFIDGGFGHNNPSFDIYTHYTNMQEKEVFPRLCMKKILMVNIGTGVDSRRVRQPDDQRRPQPPQTHVKRHRQSLTGITNMLRQMKSHTTNAQAPFYILKAISRANEGMLDIHRFTADTGLHKIKLDEYRQLEEIERLTNEYLNRPEIAQELVEVAKKLVNGWKDQHTSDIAPLSIGDDEIVPAPASKPQSSDWHGISLPEIHRQAATPPPDGSVPLQEASAQAVSPPTADTTSLHSFIQLPDQPLSYQHSPSTMLGSTSGADTLGEDVIDIGPASDRVERSNTTPLSIRGIGHDLLPETHSPRSARLTGSLDGTTAPGSPNPTLMGEDSPRADINNKEVAMALGGQFVTHGLGP